MIYCILSYPSLSVYLSLFSAHLPTQPFIHPTISVYPSIHSSVHPSIHLSFHPSIHPLVHPSINLPIHPLICSSICPSLIRSSYRLYVHPSPESLTHRIHHLCSLFPLAPRKLRPKSWLFCNHIPEADRTEFPWRDLGWRRCRTCNV